jgi:hypothetical protein
MWEMDLSAVLVCWLYRIIRVERAQVKLEAADPLLNQPSVLNVRNELYDPALVALVDKVNVRRKLNARIRFPLTPESPVRPPSSNDEPDARRDALNSSYEIVQILVRHDATPGRLTPCG